MKISIIGTIFTDIKGHPLGTFIPDGRNVGTIETVHGGVGRNIAEDLAMLGAKPDFVSLVSQNGDDIISHLSKVGVCTDHIARAKNGSGTWLAIFNENGDVVSSISVRADLTGLPALIDAHEEEIFADTDWIILEIDVATPIVESVFRYAKQYGKKVCCAVATMSQALDKKDCLKHADLFICNLQEAGMLFEEDYSGLSLGEVATLLPAKIRSFGLQSMIVTMSSEGSVYASLKEDGGDSFGICPCVKTIAVDTTGAGDSYCAGVVYALCRGLSLKDACSFGAKVSAKVVASASNVLSEPFKEEVHNEL